MKPLVDKKYKIERKAEKGGWHYVAISGIPSSNKNSQGLVRVKGFIDDYEIRQFNLLPMKTGEMLLVLKASLRKAIGKKAGDTVHVTLFTDKSKVRIPEEILDSLLQSQRAYDFFFSLRESNKKYYIDWVNESKTVETKVNRIVKMIKQLENKRKFWGWPSDR
ncbi:MAG TPA: YdeI/OmpD-associated family protein [Puia sp.]|nr:YdeI/OmpD-associated family protein [Puia sp.]